MWTDLELTYIINSCTIALAFIALSDDIAKSNPRILFFFKNIIFKIISIAIILGINLWANGKKDDNAEQKQNLRDLRNFHSLDSATENNTRHVIDTVNKGLQFIGFRIDTSSKSYGRLVSHIADSVKKDNNYKEKTIIPDLSTERININKLTSDSIVFDYTIRSRQNKSYNVKLKVYSYSVKDGAFYPTINPFMISNGIDISVDRNQSKELTVSGPNAGKSTEEWFLLLGTYEDENHKEYKVDQLILYNIPKNIWGIVEKTSNPVMRQRLIDFNKIPSKDLKY